MPVSYFNVLPWMTIRFTKVGPMRAAIGVITLVGSIAVVALSFYAFEPKTALLSCLLGCTMLAIAAIDAHRYMIPDFLSLPAIAFGLLASGCILDPSTTQPVSLDHVIGACVGGVSFWLLRASYWRLRGREGLGLGDVKLAAAGGAWVGWASLSYVVLLAAVVALAFASARAIVRRSALSRTERIAFGTFLAPSIWIVWALGSYAAGL
jgi:leader peptidase (prepilin peptidase)/N-methyltransferase